MRYDWDKSKEESNIKKHGVSFNEEKEALECELVVVLRESRDANEDRFVYLGMCKTLKVLVVVVAYPDDQITRIISARKANKKERKFYETQL